MTYVYQNYADTGATYAYTRYNVGRINCLRVSFCTVPFAKFTPELQAKIRATISRYNSGLMADLDMDAEIQLLLWVMKQSEFFTDLSIGRHEFIIKVRPNSTQRFGVRCDIDKVIFEDFDLWRVRNIPAMVRSDKLYHTSPFAGVKELIPSYGGRIKNHSVYCDPRVYCTSEPTTAGGWPLLRGASAEQALRNIEKMCVTNKDQALHYLVKWLAHSEDLYIYEMPKAGHKVYLDPETPTGTVFYINTEKNIPVKLTSSDDKINYEYLHSKAPMLVRAFMDSHPEIQTLARAKAAEKQIKTKRMSVPAAKWVPEYL